MHASLSSKLYIKTICVLLRIQRAYRHVTKEILSYTTGGTCLDYILTIAEC